MSAIARYFKRKGMSVSGYDRTPSALTDALQQEGIEVHFEDDPVFIPKDVEHCRKPVFSDFKTVLQEVVQKNPEEKVEYVLIGEEGPDHNKRFVVEVCLNSQVIGKGKGRSKKEAEQLAAKEALELMGYETQ